MDNIKLRRLRPGSFFDFASGLKVSHIIVDKEISEFDQSIGLIFVITGTIKILKNDQESEILDFCSNQLVLVDLQHVQLITSSNSANIILFSIPPTGNTLPYELASVNLAGKKYQNNWIVGYGNLPLKVNNFSLAHVRFEDQEEFATKLLPREVYHHHVMGDEYYLVLEGGYRIRVDNQVYFLDKFTLVEIPKTICHKWEYATFPVRGLNFRFPSIEGDKCECH